MGELLGYGTHRKVFACKLRPDLVVKVEEEEYRYFANVTEQKFWDDNREYKPVSQWLAPCEFLSPDGRLLLQRRAEPAREKDLPDKIPSFLTDLKLSNFGWLDGRLVCVDYAITLPNPNIRLRKADWRIS